ncbi:PIN-like domain-containing protein [Serratia marcescens]|uniref:PIN-like domain-containing protein n=1 Tax=Serratia marcescens TaxID=615 RepID=UPI004036D5CB
MKHIFNGFYSLNDEEKNRNIWSARDTIFIFDTNCLLNLYRCEDATRDDILSVMKKLSDRIWLPFFVCLEYQKNRRDVIIESIENLNLIRDSLKSISTSVLASLSKGKVKKYLYNSLSDSIHALKDDITPLIENFINEHIDPRIEGKEQIAQKDVIREHIDSIVRDNCGNLPSAEWIKTVNQLGEYRFENQIPPGFMDSSKTGKKFYLNLEFEEKYGDLYIWREIIERSKTETVNNVIFICDDNKRDWWYEKKGITHGALESLQTEIYSETGIANFKLLNQATFLHDAQKYIPNINIDSKSLKEIQEIYEIDEIQHYTHEDEIEDSSSSFNEYIREFNTLSPNPYSRRYTTTDGKAGSVCIHFKYAQSTLGKLNSSKDKLRATLNHVKPKIEGQPKIFSKLLVRYYTVLEELTTYINILIDKIENAYEENKDVIAIDTTLMDDIDLSLFECNHLIKLLLNSPSSDN